MKRPINVPETFSKLQKLPIEISFEQVEQWVKDAPKHSTAVNRWLPYWLVQLASWRPFN